MVQTTNEPSALRTLIKICQLDHAKKSDPLGAQWCKHKFIGRMRDETSERLAQQTLSFGVAPAAVGTFLESLAEECRACRECERGRR